MKEEVRSRELGGYFELELSQRHPYPHSAALHINSARNGFLHVLESVRPSHVYLPSYLCQSMRAPLLSTGISHTFYHIDERLEIARPPALNPDELILYVNYFGLKNGYVDRLRQHYGRTLVLDNSQALLSPPTPGTFCVYSPRKFLGVCDGGLVYGTPPQAGTLARDSSVERTRHLVGRLDDNASKFYPDYRHSEESLAGRPLRAMSMFTEAVLRSVDYARIRVLRERNFWYLHAHLGTENRFEIVRSEVLGPMVYPFWSARGRPKLREHLIENRIYVAKYWSEVLSNPLHSELDEQLTNEVVPLPIDQRYGLSDMDVIIDAILNQ